MSASPASRRTLLLVLAFTVLYIGWGTTYLANHFLLREIPPFVVGSLRFLLAGLLALAWALASGRAHLGRQDLGSVLIGGLLLIAVAQGALIFANRVLPTGLLAMLYTTLPLWSVALEWLLGDRPPLRVLAGLAVAIAGIVLLMGKGFPSDAGPAEWFAGALVVGATLLWAVGAWLMRRRAPFRSQWTGLALQMLTGSAILSVCALLRGDWQGFGLDAISHQGWLWLAYLVGPVSLGVYPAYFWLLREVRPSLVSTFAFVNPLVALLLGYLLLGERLSGVALLACVATLAGVTLIVLGRR
ncbi:EamA family transporter [Pseudomonas mangiferae]|uniref:EamA family transporter n=1 Tax=Pseudomonas mangiferae TaxID=2593654 RepID=A0A553H2H2_9PSED|nr:EamA family transporter [Pseudomonas mangiferae]TRX75954.1 EamA family transporter [Pseudomonas mangiferae]